MPVLEFFSLYWPALAICVVAIVLAFKIQKYFNLLELTRRKRVAKVSNFDTIDAPESFSDSHESQLRIANSHIKRRFSIIRRTVILLILCIASLVAAIPLLNVASAATFSIVAGIASVVIGIAARPFLENFISGIVISVSNRIHIGDTIYIDGELGTIEDITTTHTTIKVWNWQRYILPNSVMLNKAIRNCSHKDELLWTHIEFTAAYEQDINELEHDLISATKASQFSQDEGQIELWPMGLDAAGVKYWLAAWARGPEDAWYLRSDMRRFVIQSFQQRQARSHLHHIQNYEQISNTQTHNYTTTISEEKTSA